MKTLRDVVLTNGPMLRVLADEQPFPRPSLVGNVVRGKTVHLRVHVESAPWIVVDTVRVLHALDPDAKTGAETKNVVEAPNGRGALAADVTLTVHAKADDALVVIASGAQSMAPVLSDGTDPAETKPWAMTGAIWIDADGDGKSLGRLPTPAVVPIAR